MSNTGWAKMWKERSLTCLKDPGIVLEMFLIMLDTQYVCHCYGSVRQSLSLMRIFTIARNTHGITALIFL